jgi:hypothetical protein
MGFAARAKCEMIDAMPRSPASWLVEHGWRLGLLAVGALLLVTALHNAATGEASWSLFAVGLASGACIGCVALGWPRRAEPVRQGVETGAFLLGCLALAIVIVFIGRYGAAAGAFLVLTGAYALMMGRRTGPERGR